MVLFCAMMDKILERKLLDGDAVDHGQRDSTLVCPLHWIV